MIDDLNKAEYEVRKYKYQHRGYGYDGFEETIDSLLNEIWDAVWSKEGVEVEDLKATYVKEKIAK